MMCSKYGKWPHEAMKLDYPDFNFDMAVFQRGFGEELKRFGHGSGCPLMGGGGK